MCFIRGGVVSGEPAGQVELNTVLPGTGDFQDDLERCRMHAIELTQCQIAIQQPAVFAFCTRAAAATISSGNGRVDVGQLELVAVDLGQRTAKGPLPVQLELQIAQKTILAEEESGEWQFASTALVIHCQ